MYAVIRTGGKQYKVAPEDVLEIEKIEGAAGDAVSFPEVLMVAGEGGPTVGAPLVSGAAVSAEVVEQGARAEGHHLQEEAPPELPAQERPPAGPDHGAHPGNPDRRQGSVESGDGKSCGKLCCRGVGGNKRIAPRFEGERQWHIKKQAVRPGTAATPKAGASA